MDMYPSKALFLLILGGVVGYLIEGGVLKHSTGDVVVGVVGVDVEVENIPFST